VGIRITKVGMWYVLFSVVVAVAATNTGNNALYMVLALMLGLLVVSGLLSRHNVRGFSVELTPPREVFARRPFRFRYRLHNRGWILPRWFLLLAASPRSRPQLIPYLGRRTTHDGVLEALMPRRGIARVDEVHVASLFPFGFFRKGLRYPVGLEVLVYPEVYESASVRPGGIGPEGQVAASRRGRGQDLHSLRRFVPGDDPRGIHWKQTARTGRMVYMEREVEAGRRLSILLDNGTGELADEADRERFEQLVSEAATAALEHLERGYQVELVTRDRTLPFRAGARQRAALLEDLALLETRPAGREPLRSRDAHAPSLRLRLDRPAAPRRAAG
jgi:uncharacterized protein (DUF58 family)